MPTPLVEGSYTPVPLLRDRMVIAVRMERDANSLMGTFEDPGDYRLSWRPKKRAHSRFNLVNSFRLAFSL